MRSAGYHVRVVPREDLGWEESPPTLLEFMRRDLRWCQGNMQYWRFVLLPGLRPVSRYQLVLAILMASMFEDVLEIVVRFLLFIFK